MRVIVQASRRQSSPIPPPRPALGALWGFSGIFFHERAWWVGGWVGGGVERHALMKGGKHSKKKKKRKKEAPTPLPCEVTREVYFGKHKL